MAGGESTRQRVFLFSDVVDSVGFKTRLGNEAYQSEYRWVDERFRQIVASIPGAEFLQDLGDGRLCAFTTSSGAVQAALVLQMSMARRHWRFEPLAIRIGIHFGEVNVRETGSYSGLAIDTAARVMGLAAGRQILMTRTIFDDARAYLLKHPDVDGDQVSEPLRWVSHGEYIFKGLAEPHEIFEVFVEGVGPGQPPPNSEKARRVDSDDLSWRPKPGEPIPYRTPTWTLREKLGAGAFGEVWLAERGATQNVFKFCFDSERLVALRREVDLFNRMNTMLGDRNDIQHVLDYHFENAPPYYVQYNYAGGGSLVDWFEKQGGIDQVPLETRLELVRQVAVALDAAHSAGVLHLDIKPANILMRREGQGGWHVALADFGMGKVNSEVLAQQKSQTLGTAVATGALDTSGGTMAYMAPEVLDLRPPTTRSDIYSLGVLFYQLVVGRIKSLAPGWEYDIQDPLLRRDIADCIAGDPERRLGSARALADLIQRLPQRRANARWKRVRRRATIGAAVLCVCAIPIVTSILYERERRLKLAASDLFRESVGTIRSVFNEASSDELRDLPALVHLRQNLVDYCQSFTLRNQAYLANYPEYYRLFEEFGDEIKAFDPKLAKQLYERAIAFQGYLLADARTIPAERIPELHVKRGELRTDMGERGAQQELEEAAASLRKLLDEHPGNPAYRFLLGDCYHWLAYSYQALGAQTEKAMACYLLSQEYLDGLVREFCVVDEGSKSSANPDKIPPECAKYRQALARSYGYQGDLYLENDDLAKAQTAYDQALAIREKLAEQNPDSELRRFELARSYQNSGRLAGRLNQVPLAIQQYRLAREMQLKLHEKKQSVVKYKTDLIFSCLNEADLYLDEGDFENALKTIELAEKVSANLPDSLDGLGAKSGTAIVRARISALRRSDDAPPRIAEARQRLMRLIKLNAGDATNAVVPPERISDPQMLYDQAVLDILSAATVPAEKITQHDQAIELIQAALRKGYRDSARFKRDRAFQENLTNSEIAELSQAMQSKADPSERQ